MISLVTKFMCIRSIFGILYNNGYKRSILVTPTSSIHGLRIQTQMALPGKLCVSVRGFGTPIVEETFLIPLSSESF